MSCENLDLNGFPASCSFILLRKKPTNKSRSLATRKKYVVSCFDCGFVLSSKDSFWKFYMLDCQIFWGSINHINCWWRLLHEAIRHNTNLEPWPSNTPNWHSINQPNRTWKTRRFGGPNLLFKERSFRFHLGFVDNVCIYVSKFVISPSTSKFYQLVSSMNSISFNGRIFQGPQL